MEGMMGGILKSQVEGKLKNGAKDVKFKSVYTWARISGFVCTLIVLGMVFNQISTPGCMAIAIVGGLMALFCEVICCFKCCNATKACATKIDKVLSYGPFFKGTLYLVIAISGFIAYHFEVVVLNVQPLPIDVLFDFILFAIPGVMYILAFIIMDKCKLRKPAEKKGAASDIEEQLPVSSPHEYVKKNIFSKACKVCGEPNAQACADAQEAAAAAAAAQKNDNPFEKVRGGFETLGARMSNGFKELGAKMKSIGTPKTGPGSPSGSSGGGGAREEDVEDNPFARRSSSRPKVVTKATVSSNDVEENPFL